MHRFTAVMVSALVFIAGQSSAHDRLPGSLPVGDHHVSDRPLANNVFACQTQFRQAPERERPWFHGDTWNPLEKPRVEGRILWPEARFNIAADEKNQHVQSNGLPVGQPTGSFPITPDQPAYRYDPNPNQITPQSLDFEIPAQPSKTSSAQCLPMGMIGFSTTGVAFYNALDDAGLDAAAHEIQDLCDGHPQGRGQYHYHASSPCLPGAEENRVVGWALDGYPIMGMVDASGATLTNADLDDCHGRAETISIDGRAYDYAYRLTREYPYTIGCFVGEVADTTNRSIRDGMAPRQNGGARNRPRAH